jgi:hypothetical protein
VDHAFRLPWEGLLRRCLRPKAPSMFSDSGYREKMRCWISRR